MRIAIENRQNRQTIKKRLLRKIAQRILDASGCPKAELSILIVDDQAIQELNREYLGKDRPTNVISFSMREGEGGSLHPDILGDIVISAETAAREAGEASVSFESELYFLLLHGILHLLGYDHERVGRDEAKRMEDKEQEIFALIQKEYLTP
jgi:probable rRNA maturation factor